VGYLDEYVRFMQTNNTGRAQNKRHEHLDSDGNNGNPGVCLQEVTINDGDSGQNETFKMVFGNNSVVEFGSLVAAETFASNQDCAVKSAGNSRTWNSRSSVQKSAVTAQNLGSDSIVGLKYYMVKTDSSENKECEQFVNMEIGSTEAETGRIETENIEAEVMGNEMIETETVSLPVTNTVASLMTVPTFVSGVGCENLKRVQISVTGVAAASGFSDMESHKKVINAVGGLLELKKQGVDSRAGSQDEDSLSLEDTMAALHKCREVSVTPISTLEKPKLDTGQTSTQLPDAKGSASPVAAAASNNTAISGPTCGIFKAEIPCMTSKMEKSKSEPKPQTEFRIQINRKNEVYLCNTETGEIKPLHTAKPSRKSCRPNSGASPVLDRPSNVPENSKSMPLGPPAHQMRISGLQQNISSGMKSEQSRQVTKTSHVNASVSGMSGTSSHIPVSESSQLVSKPGSGTFPDKAVNSSDLNLSQSELVKPSQSGKPSVPVTAPHVSKVAITRKPAAALPLSSKGHSAASAAANQKRNRRKPKYIIHNAHGKMSRHTIELQEALDSCVESMLATERADNSVTLFGPGSTSDTMVRSGKSLPGLMEETITTYGVNSGKSIPQRTWPDKHWPSLGREVIVETTPDATPPLLEVSPPLLEPASSHQLTSSGEEGSSQPPQLTPESITSIRTATTSHITVRHRKCKLR
jgi:hypothetical protein